MSGSRGRTNPRDLSINTIQMIEETSAASGHRYQEQKPENAKRLRDFYREYCDAVRNNKVELTGGPLSEINVLDVLADMRFVDRGPSAEDPKRPLGGGHAVASEVVNQQRHKFVVQVSTDADRSIKRGEDADDFVKNLFKMLCGIEDMRLKQRGHNAMPDGFLRQYLDGINLNLMDSDLILLNQLATLKNVSNRKAFSLSDQ